MCEFCECVVGDVYDLCQGNCEFCESELGEYQGTYLGMEGSQHKFRVHNCVCFGCGFRLKFAYADCADRNGINVTEEFNVMFHRKESHWVGGSNAKRQSE